MVKKKFIIFAILLIFLNGCGYSPIFSKKNNFSIIELAVSGNKEINKIIINSLNYYKVSEGENSFSVIIDNSLGKEISSKDTKGNPKTFKINVISKIKVKNSKGEINEKIFSKSINYNNKSNKFDLKTYENETIKNFGRKISEEIIIYLQSI
tara:strand:+ start:1009 stop:1464 length:456 start_codon:yes stop_codon:yes gene_type:complete